MIFPVGGVQTDKTLKYGVKNRDFLPRRLKIAHFLPKLASSTYSSVVGVEKSRYRLGGYMYRCYRCGRVVEKPLEGSGMMCSCGSRIFMKVRPQKVRRMRAI